MAKKKLPAKKKTAKKATAKRSAAKKKTAKKKVTQRKIDPPNGKTWRQAKEDLVNGNKRFQKLKGPSLDPKQPPDSGPRSFNRCERTATEEKAWPWDAGQQFPYAVVVTCADSRVTPEAIFDTGIGELFVIRIAGNTATVETIASIEYAVNALDPAPQLVVVLGHEKCGAVNAALTDNDYGESLNTLLAPIKLATLNSKGQRPKPGRNAAANDKILETAVKDNVYNTVKELKKLVRDIPERESALELVTILPAYYHLESGKVQFLRER